MNKYFQQMALLFFSQLPDSGPAIFEYINLFKYNIKNNDLIKFSKQAFDITCFTSVLNNAEYTDKQKKALLNCLAHQHSFKDILLYIYSLEEKNKLFCVDSLNHHIISLKDLGNDTFSINALKSFLKIQSRDDFSYIFFYSDKLSRFKLNHPETLLAQEIAKWKISDFIKMPISNFEKYSKTLGWQLIKNYPTFSNSQDEIKNKDVFFQLFFHIKENKNDYVKYYPYAIFAYNLILQIDPLVSDVIPHELREPITDEITLDSSAKTYTLRYLNSILQSNKGFDSHINTIVEKEIIKASIVDNIFNESLSKRKRI